MCLVANATGLKPDRPDFHAPLTRATELPDVYCPREDGGLLERRGVLDVFNCLRKPEDASFAGGVFVVVELADEKTGALFHGKGIPVSRNRRYGLAYNPSHLLGVEAPISIVAAARLRHDMLDADYRPVCDLVGARSGIFRPATGSTSSASGTRCRTSNPAPGCRSRPGKRAAPYYMAVGRTLARPVRQGAYVTADDVDEPEGSVLWRLAPSRTRSSSPDNDQRPAGRHRP
jgi:predicted homoserine dehydrogenase-like protein